MTTSSRSSRRASKKSCCRTRRPMPSSAWFARSWPNAGRDKGSAMEQWSFPPRYDADYLPPAGSRYWFRERETMDPAERERHILERLKQVTRYAWDRSPFYRRKWEEAGFHPDQLKSLEDFESKVPVIAKKDLRESQGRVPPFGD